jgi:hypothetical protein
MNGGVWKYLATSAISALVGILAFYLVLGRDVKTASEIQTMINHKVETSKHITYQEAAELFQVQFKGEIARFDERLKSVESITSWIKDNMEKASQQRNLTYRELMELKEMLEKMEHKK